MLDLITDEFFLEIAHEDFYLLREEFEHRSLMSCGKRGIKLAKGLSLPKSVPDTVASVITLRHGQKALTYFDVCDQKEVLC